MLNYIIIANGHPTRVFDLDVLAAGPSRVHSNISRRRNMLTLMSELCLRVPRGRARLLVRSAQAEDWLMMLRLHVSAEVGRLARRRVKVRAGERIASDDAPIPDPTQHLEATDKPS